MRLLLALATIYNYHIHQMDVITAFFNGTLHEEIFITQPKGYIEHGTAHQVCRLLKSLYGLNRHLTCGTRPLTHLLLSHGFFKCTSDPNVYIM